MKRLVSIFLILTVILGMTGCSEAELKYFDKLNKVQTSKSEFNSETFITINPETFADSLANIINDYTDDELFKITDEDVDNFIGEMRNAFDHNKMFTFSIKYNGKYDPDIGADYTQIMLNYNNYSVDLGNVYIRDGKIYISKKTVFTIMQLNCFINNDENSLEKLKAVDTLFENCEYVVYDITKSSDLQTSNMMQYNIGFINSYNETTKNDFLEYFSDYSTDVVTETENGIKIEINIANFKEFVDSYIGYIFSNPEKTISFYNKLATDNYDNIYNSLGIIGGTDMPTSMDLSNAVTSDDIKAVEEVYKASGFEEGYNKFKEVFDKNECDISYVYEIIDKDETNTDFIQDIKFTKADEALISIKTTITYATCDYVEIEDVYSDTDISKLEKLINKALAEKEIEENEFNEGYCKYCEYYYCEACDNYFKCNETDICDICREPHLIYEYDNDCDKQHGCEYSCPNHDKFYYGMEYCEYCEYYYCADCDSYLRAWGTILCDECGETHIMYEPDYDCDKQPGCKYSCPEHGKLYYGMEYCEYCEYYYCADCDSYLRGLGTILCDECGETHIMYEPDYDCDKQPGCQYSCPKHGKLYYGMEIDVDSDTEIEIE